MSLTNLKWKNNNHEPAAITLRRAPELMKLVPRTGFIKTSASTNEVPSSNNRSNNNSNHKDIRETGFVEKILHSYGFIQCISRRDRLFFHFSEFKGDSDQLEIGDLVEFQQSYDPLTNKPVAVGIVRTKTQKKSNEIVSEKPVVGIVLSEAKYSRPIRGDGEAPGLPDGLGRVTYEQSGETFFLSYSLEDVDGGQKICAGNHVEFYIATDERNSNLRARNVRRASSSLSLTSSSSSSSPDVVYQGVVCSLKENYGFIDRSDVVKETFFHFSEFQGDLDGLNVGDDVAFTIQTRNNKEVAVAIRLLPFGSVVFEDISSELKKGKIIKLHKFGHNNRHQSDTLSGRILYETAKGPTEIVFGEDLVFDYTLMLNDLVEFNVAVDRRDKLQHASNIRLLQESFLTSAERREKGFVTTLKDAFGFIRCTDREARMFFHFSELLDQNRSAQMQDEVEFTVIQDPSNESRQIAVRIRFLSKGSISVEKCLPEKYTGNVEKESGNERNNGQEPNPGIIIYDFNNTKQSILYSSSSVDGNLPKLGDKIEFQIFECHRTKTKTAVNVRVVGRTGGGGGGKDGGFIVTLKDSFGFIETADHDREIFFHYYSLFDGDVDDLELGDEVEFKISQKGGKMSAENLQLLPLGSLSNEDILQEVLDGRIAKPLCVAMSDQTEYSGLIQLLNKEGDPIEAYYPYSIMSLVDKRDLPQRGETVRLQLAIARDASRKKRAVKVAPTRRYIHAKVDSLSNECGTLNYEKDEGRLTFLVSDVQDKSDNIAVGDEVEFVVVQNLHGSRAAFNVRKTCEKPRPERLISRLRSVTDDQGPKVIAVRQPIGPDNSKGFKLIRSSSKPSY